MWNNRLDRDIKCAKRRVSWAIIVSLALFTFTYFYNAHHVATMPVVSFLTGAALLAMYAGIETGDVLFPLVARRYFLRTNCTPRWLTAINMVVFVVTCGFAIVSAMGLVAMLGIAGLLDG